MDNKQERQLIYKALQCYKEVCKREIAARKPGDATMHYWRDDLRDITFLEGGYSE